MQSILESWPDLPFIEFGLADVADLAQRELRDLTGDRFLVTPDQDGAAAWRPLGWDSSIFGLAMGRLDFLWARDEQPESLRALLRMVLEDARSQGIRHLATRMKLARTASIQVLEEFGFRYVDSLHTLSRTGIVAPQPDLTVRSPRPEDLPLLLRMARHAFTQNRFASDVHLSSEKAGDVYEQWAENGILGKRGDYAAVLELDGQPAGFITCLLQSPGIALEPKIGVIDLIAVAPAFHGRGGGHQLVQAALEWFAPRTVAQSVGTRCDNYPALSLYMKAGFRLSSSHLGMHLWL